MLVFQFPVRQPLATVEGWQRTAMDYRLVAMPPQTGFVECIRWAKIRQVAFWRDGTVAYLSIGADRQKIYTHLPQLTTFLFTKRAFVSRVEAHEDCYYETVKRSV